MEMSKLIKCALTNSEATKQTQIVATLSGQTGPMASDNKCALFFSNFPKTSIMCADTSKKINSDNIVSNLNTIIFGEKLDNYFK